jgi:archaellum component FlaC
LKTNGKGAKMDHRLLLVAMAIRGGNSGTFDKVISMVDKMVALLGKEQTDDDDKKAYCDKELDKAEDDLKILENKISDLGKAIDETKELIATLKSEIEDLTKSIAQLDADVKQATATREEENALYKKTMAENTAAMDILKMAKNRLAKFYTPKLYKAPAKKELSSAGAIERDMSFVQIRMHEQDSVAPPPPPETFGAYQKKGEENAGVTEMMQLLMTDLETEMTQMTTDEDESQKEYEEFMADAGATRAADSKSLKDKKAAKADAEANLEKLTLENKATLKAAYDQTNVLKDLHLECDWLLANYENRKGARTGEVESLKKAKAVLSGADFSFLQRGVVRSLRGA